MSDRFRPGQVIYSIAYDDDVPVILEAEYVGQNRSWHTLRNPDTGRTWKINGTYWWHPSPEPVLRRAVEFLARILTDSVMLGICKLTHDRAMTRLVRCAARLDRLLSGRAFP